MRDDAGNLSIDFLAGFTIFMISFIYVATLVPTLFLNVQGSAIDYDAVAYRTSVILVEDPGMPYNPSWETFPNTSDSQILRFGLAISKDTPGILSQVKINRFFCTTEFSYPSDYQSRAVFGDYPYKFNISLKNFATNITQSVGDALPENYGYSRRVVKIKEHSSVLLNFTQQTNNPLYIYTETPIQTGNSTSQVFSIYFNYTDLLSNGPYGNSPAYQINPLAPAGTGQITGGEGALINMTGLGNITQNPNSNITTVNLTSIAVYRSVSLAPLGVGQSGFEGPVLNESSPTQFELFIDGNATPVTSLPRGVANNVSLFIPPGLLSFLGQGDSSTLLNVTMQFTLSQPDRYLNTTQVLPSGAFMYNYTNPNVTQPYMQDGIMEIGVW